MAFKMACAETGANCPFEVQTETRDEILQHVAIHAQVAHPEMTKPPTPEQIDQLIHVV